MLTINKLQTWAKNVPSNVKARVCSLADKLDFNYMTLDEATHTYSSTKNPDVRWTSVTTWIKQFKPEEDWNEIAIKYGKKNGMQPDAVKEMWKHNGECAASIGSTCHLFGELICNIMIDLMLGRDIDNDISAFKLVFPFQLKEGVFIPCMIGQSHVIKFWEQVINEGKRWPIAAECIVDDPSTSICGTVDLLMLESDMTVSMWDYKTTKKLNNQFARDNKTHLLNEFSSLYDEPLSEYAIQMAQYKKMLSKHNIDISNTRIIHIPNTEMSEMKIVDVDTSNIITLLS